MPEDWLVCGNDIRPLLRQRGVQVAVDTETTGLDFTDEPLGMSLAWRGPGDELQSAYLVAPVGQRSLMESMFATQVVDIHLMVDELCMRHPLVFHNEPFDVRVLHKISPSHTDPTFHSADTMHLAGLLEWQPARHLIDLYSRYVREGDTKWKDMKGKRKNLKNLPLEQVTDYARTDAEHTLEIGEQLLPRVDRQAVYKSDRDYAALVMRLIRRGLKLDFAWCQKREREYLTRMDEIAKELKEVGLTHPSSNPDVAYFLFKVLNIPTHMASGLTKTKNYHFPAGIPSVDEDTIEAVGDLHPVAKKIKEWRQLSGAVSEYTTGYRNHASVDGRVHALLDPFGTVSSRMAASRPNVMAMPMEDRGAAFGNLTGMFVSEYVGQKLWACDLSQAEVRLAAIYAKELSLMEMLSSGGDPYVAMALRVWNDPARRNDAKRATLASIYEVGPDKFAATHHIPVDDAYSILADFRRFYPKIKLASSMAATRAKRMGYVEAYSGRRRYFGPDEAEHKAFNQIIQTGIAEIMKAAMLNMAQIAPLHLQIHDSLIMSLPNNKVKQEKIKKDVQAAVADAIPKDFAARLPFPVKFKEWQ